MRIFLLFKQSLGVLIYVLGIYKIINKLLVLLEKDSQSFVVLCYHGVDVKDIKLFEEQLDYLRDHDYVFLSGNDVKKLIEQNGILCKKDRYVLLTFDDCCLNNYTVVKDVLLKKNIPAVFFAPTRMIGRSTEWNHKDSKQQIMSIQQLKEMAENFDIGSHTQNHVRLACVGSKVAEGEILGSLNDLEKMIEKKIDFFAYPNGSYNHDTIYLIKKYQLTAAFTVEQHTNYNLKNKHRLGRYIIKPQEKMLFKMKVNGCYDLIYYLQTKIKSVFEKR